MGAQAIKIGILGLQGQGREVKSSYVERLTWTKTQGLIYSSQQGL